MGPRNPPGGDRRERVRARSPGSPGAVTFFFSPSDPGGLIRRAGKASATWNPTSRDRKPIVSAVPAERANHPKSRVRHVHNTDPGKPEPPAIHIPNPTTPIRPQTAPPCAAAIKIPPHEWCIPACPAFIIDTARAFYGTSLLAAAKRIDSEIYDPGPWYGGGGDLRRFHAWREKRGGSGPDQACWLHGRQLPAGLPPPRIIPDGGASETGLEEGGATAGQGAGGEETRQTNRRRKRTGTEERGSARAASSREAGRRTAPFSGYPVKISAKKYTIEPRPSPNDSRRGKKMWNR
ncbi:hypothetical protein WN55_09134 [Dufourea novaeangliae]|uniref:Uncharacterized protein n=1 Tax=Dufourea novaeangliae TaxID=178035 RepID=A0A154P896_DUFNO|nr:hypothetical protein WN55_09134 [Dufourea novaeangliae]